MVFSSCLIFVPFLLHVPSGRLSGPTLNPVRCFFGRASPDSPSLGLFGAIVLLLFCIVDVVFLGRVFYKIDDVGDTRVCPTSLDLDSIAEPSDSR